MAFRPGKSLEGVRYLNEVNYNRALKRIQERERMLEPIRRAKAQYAPGGAFGTGVEAQITRGRKKAVSVGAQELVGAGLGGTTMVGGLGTRYEEEVGMPARLSIEERRAEAMAGIEMAEAGMGFEVSQAGLQRQFQAGQAGAQRDLQRYIADMQARLQRESMAFRVPTGAPTGGRYAQQFPSVYGAPTRPSPGVEVDDVDFGDTPWSGSFEEPEQARTIPGQFSPSAMSEYLKTYIPRTGDVSVMPRY